MSTLATLRVDIASALTAATSDDVTVYAHPADVSSLPAIVIVPADPWWVPKRMSQTLAGAVSVFLDLQLMVLRDGEVSEVLGKLESLAAAAAVAGLNLPTWKWLDLGQPEPIEVNQVRVLMARLAIQATV